MALSSRALVVIGVASSWLAGCSPEGREAQSSVTRVDSAGIEIVTSSGPAWTAETAWRLSSHLLTDIGSLDGPEPYQLFGVTDAVRLANGRIVVANSGSSEMRFYDSRGNYLSTSGGEGEGPGEFRRLSAIYHLGDDSLVAWDGRLRRMALFGEDGAYARSVALISPSERTSVWLAGVLNDRSLQVQLRSFSGPGDIADGAVRQSEFHLATYGLDGLLRDTVGLFPNSPVWIKAFSNSPAQGFIVRSVPFTWGTSFSVGGDKVYISNGERAEVRAFLKDGTIQLIARYSEQRLPVSQDLFDAWLEQLVARAPTHEAAQREREMNMDIPPADSVAFSRSIVADALGNSWLQAIELPADTVSRWTVVASDGTWLGRISVPLKFRVFDVGADWILGSWRDDLDVEHVQMYAIEKP